MKCAHHMQYASEFQIWNLAFPNFNVSCIIFDFTKKKQLRENIVSFVTYEINVWKWKTTKHSGWLHGNFNFPYQSEISDIMHMLWWYKTLYSCNLLIKAQKLQNQGLFILSWTNLPTWILKSSIFMFIQIQPSELAFTRWMK